MTIAAGFGAGCLVHCEMYGLSGYQVSVITDGHYVTVESMQAFKPVLTRLGLPDNVDNLLSGPTSRQIVKEAN